MTVKVLVLYNAIDSEYEFADWFNIKFNHNVINSCKYGYKLQLIRKMVTQGISTDKIDVITEEYVED